MEYPLITTPEEPEEATKTGLAQALAHGVTVASWARAHNVPRNTAYRWSNDPEVRRMVLTFRRRILDRAVGRMARRATKSAEVIVEVANRGTDRRSVLQKAAATARGEML
jgi:transposase-like protein